MSRPMVGQVYERDGRRREVVRVTRWNRWDEDADKEKSASTFYVWWKPPHGVRRVKPTWCASWEEWVCKAKLVEESADAKA